MKINDENRKKVLMYIAVGVLFFGLLRVLFFEKKEFDFETKTDPFEMVDLSIELEEKFLLKDVRVTETEGGLLEIRLETPVDVSEKALLVGAASIFGYAESYVSSDIEKIRIIFTVNYLDAMFIEVENKDIKNWLEGNENEEDFLNKFKVVNLSEN
jgi:hypothetical protein